MLRRMRAAFAAPILLCAPIPLGSCAAATSYAGIPLAAGAVDPELQSIARRARSGDKNAQLELGIRYEEGRGVAVDRGRAERLYRMAARPAPGTIYAYFPPVGRHGQGRVLPISREPRRPGLEEARLRLRALLEEDGK